MQFVVKNKVDFPHQGFYIEITFMSGDADHYDTETIGPINRDDYEDAYGLIRFLDKLEEARRSWKYSIRRFESMDVMPEGAKRYIYQEECSADFEYIRTCDGICEKCEYDNNQSSLAFEWPRDVLDLSYEYNAAYDGYKIYFINQFGEKYDVAIDYEGV